MKSNKLFGIFKLNSRFSLIILAFTFVPIAVLAGVLFRNLEDDVIKESHNYMESKIIRDYGQITTNIESINMSTRFFLSDEGLREILISAYDGEELDIREILDFYNTEISDLERLVNNNPLLYAVRVYAVTDNVQEMMPILYNKSRMEKLEWASEERAGWHFGYFDTLFSSLITDQSNRLTSYVTVVTDYDRGIIGYVEAAMTMRSMFSGMYENIDNEWSFFTDNEQYVMFGNTNDEDVKMAIGFFDTKDITKEGEIIYKKDHGRYYTVARYPVSILGGSIYSVQDITDEIKSVYNKRNLFVFVMSIVLVITAMLIDRMVRNFQEEVLAKNSEIRSLQNQINAHFIYNVLESIKMMAEIDEKYEISDAITSLGKLMRYSMKWTSRSVHLKEELEYIKNYVLLINLRYDFEVILSINVPPNLMDQEILKMSLQPIVENAVIHGIEPVAADTTIYIKAWEDSGTFKIEITDSGKGMSGEELKSLLARIHGEIEESGGEGNGIGLKNVEDRIKLAYGNEFGLEVYSQPLKYTKVAIVLPRRVLERKSIS